MAAGEKNTERIEAENACGERREELVFSVPQMQMPEGSDVEVGDMLRFGFPDGNSGFSRRLTALSASFNGHSLPGSA